MAYAALVSLEQTIHQILNQDLYSTSLLAKHHIASLGKCVISFQAFLDDFPEKTKNLEAKIRNAATAAEDIIECFMLDQIQLYHRRWIHDLSAGIKFTYRLYKVAKKMKAIAIDHVTENKNSVIIKDKKLGDSSIVRSSSTDLPSGKIDVVGFEDDLLEIKDRLAGRSPQLQYLAISGMGGIGKTTLARNAYDDQLIQEHFDIRAWVTISQDYRAQEILSCLLDSMKEFDQKESKERIEVRVHKILKGRRYLIVMDDIWSTKVLDDVRRLFPDDCNGSRIMLTTRLSDVAAYNADSSPYEMHLMDEEKSWGLLRQKVFSNKRIAILSDELEMIGQEIARSCRGLPLAVVVIAGILSSVSESPASWAEVAKNIKKANSNDDRMEEIVSLGYNHLPHRLRACLLYMGLLPEDHSIRVSLLVKLWIAEGFLKHPDNSSKSLEADAEEHLEDLVKRNLILATQRKYNGKIKSCGLHDLVRDTCIRMLEEENHLRHVTAKEDNQGCISKRSVLCFGNNYVVHPFLLERFRLLRILHVPNFEYISGELLRPYHLRHLCFHKYWPIREDMPDISNFQNLHSLIIESRMDIRLPASIWNLRQLRHLKVDIGRMPDPDETSGLENLQTLKRVVFDEMNIKSLERVPNLIKLGLVFDSNNNELHLNESLVCLRQLQQLRISSRSGYHYQYPNHLSAVFPESLKKLTQNWGRASVSYLEALGSLPNLEVLQLWCCGFENAAWEVRGGEFPKLKMLQLKGLRNFTTFIVEEDGCTTAFPMLNCLHIYSCYDLEELSDEIGDIPTLQLIEVSYSGKGACDWARRVEEEQQSYGNDTLQVRIN